VISAARLGGRGNQHRTEALPPTHAQGPQRIDRRDGIGAARTRRVNGLRQNGVEPCFDSAPRLSDEIGERPLATAR